MGGLNNRVGFRLDEGAAGLRKTCHRGIAHVGRMMAVTATADAPGTERRNANRDQQGLALLARQGGELSSPGLVAL